jgi:hypothetical protein
MNMYDKPMSDGLQILSKYFAMKIKGPEAASAIEFPPVAPTLPQATASLPVIQTPSVQSYEPIGRGRGPKILLTVILVGIAGYFLNRKLKQWKKSKKES